jgi:hypothetical protein
MLVHNQKSHVGAIFCDLAKAFDCKSRNFINKIALFLAFKEQHSCWFRAYLTYRKQNIESKSSNLMQNTYSNWGTIKHDVPQESVLGPLLFQICINDLSTLNTSSIPLIFADDTNVIIYSKNLDDHCILSNEVLSQMSKWFFANKLPLNLDKTNVIKINI